MEALPVLKQEYITVGCAPRQVAFSMFLVKPVQPQKACRYLQEADDIPSADIKSSEQMQYLHQWLKFTTFCWKEFEDVIQLPPNTSILMLFPQEERMLFAILLLPSPVILTLFPWAEKCSLKYQYLKNLTFSISPATRGLWHRLCSFSPFDAPLRSSIFIAAETGTQCVPSSRCTNYLPRKYL